MPAGFEAYYANGSIALSITDRTARLMNTLAIAAGTTGGVSVPKAANENVFAFLVISDSSTSGGCGVNQTTGVITYELNGPSGGILYYGVF